MSRPDIHVWRIALLWHGTVLDVVTLEKPRGTITLRTGEQLKVRAGRHGVDIEGLGAVDADVVTELPAGHAVLASRVAPEARVGRLSALDATLFHAAMIGAALQACVVSALVLAPNPSFDTEPGAGLPGPWRRYLVSPGGTAPNVGTAQLSMVGRTPDDAERVKPERRRGDPPPTRAGKGMTLEQALEEMNRVLHLGNDGADLKEAIGAIAQAQARAPVQGAAFGGLAPKDPAERGPGNGLIGAGESTLTEVRRRIAEQARKADLSTKLPPKKDRTPIPVSLLELEPSAVTVAADEGFDPVVRDTLQQAVRERDNVVRACYEDRGLRMGATRAGKLTLTLTLLPDGHVTDAEVKVDNHKLDAVGECVLRVARQWYLGDQLVKTPTRLNFPFILTPHNDVDIYDFSNEAH